MSLDNLKEDQNRKHSHMKKSTAKKPAAKKPAAKTRLTTLDVVDETIRFYASTKRFGVKPRREGDVQTRCVYNNPDTGNRCAVGRFLSPRGVQLFGSYDGAYDDMIDEGFSPQCHFIEPVQHIDDVEFWEKLQDLHDRWADNLDGYRNGSREIEHCLDECATKVDRVCRRADLTLPEGRRAEWLKLIKESFTTSLGDDA